MTNCKIISRSAKIHGHYAGRTQAEQDAYFDFFAEPMLFDHATIAAIVRNVFAHIRSVREARRLRRLELEVLSSASTSNP